MILHPRVATMVDELLQTGLFGRTRAKVVAGLFLAQLRERELDGWCGRFRRPVKK